MKAKNPRRKGWHQEIAQHFDSQGRDVLTPEGKRRRQQYIADWKAKMESWSGVMRER